MEGDFTGIDSVDLVTKSTEELRSLVQERREQRELERQRREERLAQACTRSYRLREQRHDGHILLGLCETRDLLLRAERLARASFQVPESRYFKGIPEKSSAVAGIRRQIFWLQGMLVVLRCITLFTASQIVRNVLEYTPIQSGFVLWYWPSGHTAANWLGSMQSRGSHGEDMGSILPVSKLYGAASSAEEGERCDDAGLESRWPAPGYRFLRWACKDLDQRRLASCCLPPPWQ